MNQETKSTTTLSNEDVIELCTVAEEAIDYFREQNQDLDEQLELTQTLLRVLIQRVTGTDTRADWDKVQQIVNQHIACVNAEEAYHWGA